MLSRKLIISIYNRSKQNRADLGSLVLESKTDRAGVPCLFLYAVKLSDCQMLSNLFVLRELLCELRKCILKKSDLIPQFVLPTVKQPEMILSALYNAVVFHSGKLL